jgi:SAM-dependent methyltransferase
MALRTGVVRGWLANARVYSLVQRLLGADAVRHYFVATYLRPADGERILDLGCGPGEILELLGQVEYLGVDLSPGYIEAAGRRFGERGRFLCADIRSLSLDAPGGFDAIISIGVLHHLDDGEVVAVMRTAADLLAPGGRLLTLDPAVTREQPRAARWLIARDRGRSVRAPDGYRELAAAGFRSVNVSVHHDLARVPYTHVMLECREPRADS